MRLGGNQARFSCHKRPILATFFGVSDKNARPWEALPPQALAALRPAAPRAGRRDHRRDPRPGARLRAAAGGRLRAGGAHRRRGGAEAVQRPGPLRRASARRGPRRLRRPRARRGARGALAGGAAGRLPRRRDRRLAPARRAPAWRPAWNRHARPAGRGDLRLHRRAVGRVRRRLRPGAGRARRGGRPAARRPDRAAAAHAAGAARRLAQAAQAAGWTLPRELAVLVWPEEAGRRLVFRLPQGCIGASVEGHWLRARPRPRRARPPRARSSARWSGRRRALGSSVVPAEGERSHRHARAALLLAVDDGRDARRRRRRAPPRPAAAQRPGARRPSSRPTRLAPLDAETDLSRARLAETLHAWLRHQGNATAAADDLDVHAQTVRYRLGRLRELFGDTLDDPDARYELETVLRARPVV